MNKFQAIRELFRDGKKKPKINEMRQSFTKRFTSLLIRLCEPKFSPDAPEAIRVSSTGDIKEQRPATALCPAGPIAGLIERRVSTWTGCHGWHARGGFFMGRQLTCGGPPARIPQSKLVCGARATPEYLRDCSSALSLVLVGGKALSCCIATDPTVLELIEGYPA
jgi:hypothetical protein